jgi:hypothetical protein
MRHLFRSVLCLLAFSTAVPAQAQVLTNPTDVTASGTAYRIFAQPGEPTVQVLVLGQGATGMYVVGAETSLVELLALTGTGVNPDGGTDVIQEITVRLMREQGGQRVVVYEQEFDSFLSEPASYPTLQDGDIFTVEVKQRRRFNLREALDVTARLASITLLALRLADLF